MIYVHTSQHMCALEDSLSWLVLSFHHVGLEEIQIVKLASTFTQ